MPLRDSRYDAARQPPELGSGKFHRSPALASVRYGNPSCDGTARAAHGAESSADGAAPIGSVAYAIGSLHAPADRVLEASERTSSAVDGCPSPMRLRMEADA
jgi:hypothetical protein